MTRFILFTYILTCYLQSAYPQAGSPSTLPAIKYHLTARPWKPLNISRNEHLDKVESVVRVFANFQDSSGAIIDPYSHHEKQYSTPYFANAVGTLLFAGKAMDLLSKGIAAMNSATADLAGGRAMIPDDHGEFFIAPLANAVRLYTPFVSSSQLQIWKTRLATPVSNIIRGITSNWRTYAMKGEWYRADSNFINRATAVAWIENSWITTQKNRFTNNPWNFYHDYTSDPDTWTYEAVSRSNLAAMIADGYNGASRNEILSLLKKGTQASLLTQDPSGQVTAGGRSADHTWNDILLANGYETMAEMMYKEGTFRLAGQYRHAAALAFKSAQRWLRSDGSYFVTKNHFDPKLKIGYASYSYFTNYNGNMMYHMAENFLRHTSPINEQATPNEIGGYTIVTDSAFATAVANAGGMSMEVCLRGSTNLVYNRFWTSLGVARFARPGWDSRLGPSDGIRDTGTKLGVSFTPTFLENGNWVRLASVPERYEAVFTTQFTHPLLVRCRIVYKPKSGKTGPTFTNDFVITPDGILSTLTSTAANFGMTWPILTFDGATNLTHNITSHIASLSFPGQTDQQNFIALHSSPTITATDAVKRSSYGDLLPVRMVSGTTGNITFIYPRSLGDPSADSVRKSFAGSGTGFSTILGKVKGNIYVGRTSAGGVGTSIDINNDSIAEASFNVNTGFLMQLKTGKITKIETAKNVTAVIYGRVYNLKAYTPTVVTYVAGVQLLEAEQAVLNGPVVASNHAGFTGSGFADYINPSGDYIEWTVNAATAGSFSLKFRYANGSTANRPLQLTVNGSTVNANLAFNVTGDWATWLVSSATANLVQGTNKIRLTATGSSGPNTDNLVVSVSPVTLARNEQSSLNAKIDMSVIAQMNMSDADCLRLVPNPANNILNIYPTGLQKNKQLIVSVISASGATVKTIQTNSSTQTLQFDISSLASGVYSIKLVSGNKILYKKFVKL